MREAGAFEFGDALLDYRVPTVVGLDLEELTIPVGHERVIVPGRKQRELTTRRRTDPLTINRTVIASLPLNAV